MGDDVYGAAGAALQDDVTNYVAGINRYITEARLNPLKMPGEYAAIGKPGPQDWKVTDVIATASLIGGIFGKGGGRELDSALLLQDAQKRFGRRSGKRVWADLRTAEDPEAPVTVNPAKRFPYRAEPRRLRRGGVALPDRGSVRKLDVVKGDAAASASGRDDTRPRRAALVPAAELERAARVGARVPVRQADRGDGPADGLLRPAAAARRGRARAGHRRPRRHLRRRQPLRAARPRARLRLERHLGGPGHHRHLRAPALRAGRVRARRVDSMHYLFRGQCTAIEVLEKTNNWTPSPADDTPPGSETLHAERTKLGLVTARASVKGKPVIYTKLRSTYFHEADSALGFVELNDPSKIRGPQDFQRAASKIGFTFNWFYVDHSHIGYFNSGNNPVRAARTSSHFPVSGRFEWRGWNPDLWSASYTPLARHPQAIDQAFLANWNNKQARGYRAADDNFGYGSIYRSQSLSDRIRKGTRGSRKMSLVQLIDAMEGAGTVDLRATKVLPWALRVVGRPPDPKLRHAVVRAARLGARRRAPARPRPQRRVRARGGDLDPRPLVVALDARRSSGRRSGRPRTSGCCR